MSNQKARPAPGAPRSGRPPARAEPATKRKYEKRRRAEREAETRRRITEAAVELHGTVGPARTTVSALADRAGVQRATVYRHFPEQTALFDACSAHWAAANPPPDLEPLVAIEDPEARLRAGLTALYGYYGDNEGMLGNVFRDIPTMPAVAEVLARRSTHVGALLELLCEGWDGGDPHVRAAAISFAIDFRTWQMLVRERGLGDAQAVELMAGAVR